MSSAARQIHGAHERTTDPIEIRVIPGGLLREKTQPRHARTSALDGIRGIGFNLSTRERVWAGVFGTLFTLVAFAVTIYF